MRRETDRFAEIKRCLAKADAVFARAGACEDEQERLRLVDEAETWLVRAERAFARLTDRMTVPTPRAGPIEERRSFQSPAAEPDAALVWNHRTQHKPG